MARHFRLVHIGVAAALAAATVTATGLVKDAGAASGTASVFVPIVPCRLVDTRPVPDLVGTRTAWLSAGDVANFQVWGTNGNCTIPTSATGIATNATAVHPTADSYVTIYPSDASPRPTASNLNVVAGGDPTPNQVTVGLSATGSISAYNNAGTLDLIIDIVGYYQAAPAGGGAQGPTGPQGVQGLQGLPGPAGSNCPAPAGCTVLYSGADAVITDLASSTSIVSSANLCRSLDSNGHAVLSLRLPVGAQITTVRVSYQDGGNPGSTAYFLVSVVGDNATTPAQRSSSSTTVDNSNGHATLILNAGIPLNSPTVRYFIYINPSGTNQAFCGADVTYTLS